VSFLNISFGSSPNYYTQAYTKNNNSPATSAQNIALPPTESRPSKSDEFDDSSIRQKKRVGQIECQTCKNRKYQDGSNDAGVSFKTPGHIDPGASAAVVMSHEQEHVRNESTNAKSENKKVLSQTVTLETSVCPECGRTYVSGGKTKTVTKGDDSKDKDYFKSQYNKSMSNFFGNSLDYKV
jgi:hypothetical protein